MYSVLWSFVSRRIWCNETNVCCRLCRALAANCLGYTKCRWSFVLLMGRGEAKGDIDLIKDAN